MDFCAISDTQNVIQLSPKLEKFNHFVDFAELVEKLFEKLDFLAIALFIFKFINN
jgi:hypothetical protein